MYLTATQILADLNKTKVLDNLMDEHKDYQLVITGHSLGAGVASVLAVLLKPKEKYSNLVCYAFSPPGCVLRYVCQTIFAYQIIDLAVGGMYHVCHESTQVN